MRFWYQFSDEWFVDSTWVVGAYLASRHDEDAGIISEWCLAGPKEPDVLASLTDEEYARATTPV